MQPREAPRDSNDNFRLSRTHSNTMMMMSLGRACRQSTDRRTMEITSKNMIHLRSSPAASLLYCVCADTRERTALSSTSLPSFSHLHIGIVKIFVCWCFPIHLVSWVCFVFVKCFFSFSRWEMARKRPSKIEKLTRHLNLRERRSLRSQFARVVCT